MTASQTALWDDVTKTHTTLPDGYSTGMRRQSINGKRNYQLVLAGAAIAAGAVCELTTSDTNGVTVDEADADSDVIVGVCETAIASGSYGWMTLIEGATAQAKVANNTSVGNKLRPSGTAGVLTPVTAGIGRGAVAIALEANSSGDTAVKTVFLTSNISGETADVVDLTSAQSISGAKTFAGSALKIGGAGAGVATLLYANDADSRSYTLPDAGAAAEFVMSEGAKTINGAITLGTPLTVANVNQSVKREAIVMNFAGGLLLVDGTTYVTSIPMRRAGTVKAICVSAHTRMAGGTNTLALAKKQGGTSVTLLSTATVDPTAVPAAADTAEALTLTATGADLIFAAGDCLKATLVCGTMTTDGQGYAVTIDVEFTDV